MKTAANDNDYRYGNPNQFFEYWSNLAKTDPERFEAERKAEIEKVISSAKPERQEKLRHLQWRIDMERARAKNPIDAMLRLNKMMWDQMYAEKGFFTIPKLWAQVVKLHGDLDKKLKEPKKEPEILPFKKD